MEQDTRDLDEVIFGILSEKDIRDISVCQIDNPKLGDKNGGYGTVYDPRMGPIENNKLCETCNMDIWKCSGHYSFIELNEYIIHPLFYKRVVDFLRCVCIKCNNLLITEDQINLNGLMKIKSTKRFDKILEKIEKIDMCPVCSHPQPDIKYTSTDNNISMVYKQKDKGKISIVIPVDDIKKTFENLTEENVKLLGFNPSLVHPKSLIMSVFPVIPYCFLKDTIVLTNNGYKNIQDITFQDKLYSHTGKFQKINEIFIREHSNGKIINIDLVYHPNTIKCTPEHPFYVKEINIENSFANIDGKRKRIKNKIISDAKWIEAENLKENHFIGMKRNTNNIIPEFLIEKSVNHKHAYNIKKTLNDLDEWYLLGIFLLKGYLCESHIGRFIITIDNNNIEHITELLNNLNITFRICEDTEYNINTTNIECHNYILYHILKDFGKSDNKKVPFWIQDAPNDYIEKFLEGFNLLNGYSHKRNKIQYHTIHKDIAFSLQLLFLKLGKIASISYQKLNNTVVLEDRNIISKNRSYLIEVVKDRKYDLNIYYDDGDYLWYKISKLEEELIDSVKVYNFEVNEDNSYCVENILSHNCCRPFVLADGQTCDDDLTIQIVEIIKANNHLKIEEGEAPLNDVKRQKYIQTLKFRISTFYNNSQNRAKHTTNGRPIKGLKERITGKEGLIRNNIMGKRCWIKGTKILLWNGNIKNVEEIKIGDILIGDDGTQREVLNLCSGEDEMYKIYQNNGDDYIVNSEHILSLKFTNTRNIKWNDKQGWFIQWFDTNLLRLKTKKIKPSKYKTKEASFKEMELFKGTLNNDDTIDVSIKNYLKLSDKNKKLLFGYKLNKPVNWCYKDIEIDPYILGMWLGDGSSSGDSFASNDIELVNYWKDWASNNNLVISQNDKFHYGMTYKGKENIFLETLKKYDLINNKHIPDDFIYNDEKTRLSLLAGLIDTDGSVEQDGVTIRITQSYEHSEILNKTQFIASSLGFQTSLYEKKTTWFHKNIKKNGIALILTISGHGIENIPTILPRKKCRPPKNRILTISNIKVEPYGIDKFYGFEINNNKRFLLGDFTVGHNCEFTGRTVIGPEPTLKMGQLGIPKEIAENLTLPVQVTNFNYEYLTNLVNDGKVNIVKTKGGEKINIHHHIFNRGTRLNHGDIIIRKDEKTSEEIEMVINNGKEMLKPGDRLKRNDEFIKNIKYPEKRKYHLNIGDICERQLQNGDIVLLNRQPKFFGQVISKVLLVWYNRQHNQIAGKSC